MAIEGIYRALHPTAANYTFFSSTHGIPMIDHMIVHRTSLNKILKTEIILKIFSDLSAIKLEINNHRNTGNCKTT